MMQNFHHTHTHTDAGATGGQRRADMKVTPHTLVLHADSVYSSESVSVTLGYVRTANRKSLWVHGPLRVLERIQWSQEQDGNKNC